MCTQALAGGNGRKATSSRERLSGSRGLHTHKDSERKRTGGRETEETEGREAGNDEEEAGVGCQKEAESKGD